MGCCSFEHWLGWAQSVRHGTGAGARAARALGARRAGAAGRQAQALGRVGSTAGRRWARVGAGRHGPQQEQGLARRAWQAA